VRIRISTAPNSSAKITPATAAARGVVSWRGLGLDDIAITSSSHRTAPQPGYFTTNFDSPQPSTHINKLMRGKSAVTEA
jgi:hypothetical protein